MAKNTRDPFEGHGKPVTRRDFLARGMLGFSGTLFAPTVVGTLLRAKHAQARGLDGCAAGGGNGFIPMLVFDCAGGAALAGNFLVGGTGGPQDLLPAYDVLGWDPRAAGALDTRFGLPMSALFSQIRAGILASSTAEAQANLRMGSFCHFSQDDTSSNTLSALILAIQQGAGGSIVNRGLGSNQGLSGGNSSAVNQDPSLQPVIVQTISDVLGAVSFGPALDALSVTSRRAVVQSALAMSMEQLNALAGGNPGAFAQQMGCAYQNAMGYTTAGPQLDPRNDSNISSIYGISSATDAADPNLIAAAIVMNVLKGQTGPGVLTIPGCDYHDGSQTTGDGIDLQIGTQIGRALEAAHVLQTPLFFQIITDGGLFAAQGTRQWGGDSGDKSMSVIGYYNPKSAPKLIHPSNPQIGAFNAGQGADQSTLVGADPGKAAYGAFANYLQVCGKLSANADQFTSVFGTGGLDQVLVFDGS